MNRYTLSALVIALPLACQAAPSKQDDFVQRIAVKRAGKIITTVSITASGVRGAYQQMQGFIAQFGSPETSQVAEVVSRLNAAQRCQLLVETLVVVESIRKGVIDSTPALEKTGYDYLTAIGQANGQTQVTCDKVP